jgi:phage N-6-adenine-methyltransferase
MSGQELEAYTLPELFGLAPNEEKGKKYAACHSSVSVEWYTPPEIIKAVLELYDGWITTDPAARMHNDPNLPARIYYTKAENGLNQDWHGKTYLNPEYGKTVLEWMNKAVEEYNSERVTEIIILWKSSTDTQAWHKITEIADQVCFIKGRLKFSGSKRPAPFPSVILYAGPHKDRFREIFSEFGQIWQLGVCMK